MMEKAQETSPAWAKEKSRAQEQNRIHISAVWGLFRPKREGA